MEMLETPRTFLRPWSAGDRRVFRRLFGDQDALLPSFLEHYREHGFGPLAVMFKEDDEIVGSAGLRRGLVPEENGLELMTLPSHRGRGLATEAGWEILRHGFEALRLKKIAALCDPADAASKRVLAKLGMAYERSILHRGLERELHAIRRPER